jgi:hypothetical protein
MKRFRFVAVMATLMLAAVACNLPGGASTTGNQATQVWGTVQAGAAETLAATTSATPFVWGTPTPTWSNYGTATTDPSGAPLATAAAQATYQAQSMQATLAANAAWATSVAQSQYATQQAWSWSATATAAAGWRPPTQLPPVPPPPGPGPNPNPYPEDTRISFKSGATSAELDGSLKAGWGEEFIIRGGENQWMLLSAYSPNNNIFLGLRQQNGAVILHPNEARNDYRLKLPYSGDFLISVVAPTQKSNYTLQVIMPARIQFRAGAISATLQGYLQGGKVNYYTAKARQGQTMTVNVYSPHNDVFLTIYGMEDGSPLVRSQMAQTSWSGVLNLTQDYMIEAVSTGNNVNYTLEVIIQ